MTASPPPGMRSAVRRAALLVAFEGVVVVVLGLLYAVLGLTGDAETTVGAEVGALLIVGWGALLLFLARALDRRRTWARGPVLAIQLVLALTGVSYLATPAWPFALAVVALVAVLLYQLATVEARDALRRG